MNKKESPLISILMPNYNYANYVGMAIESVLQQTWTDFELIIVDDASTDNSRAMISKYTDDPRIKLFTNKINVGVFENVEKAFSYSKGKYVIMMPSDDYLFPTFLEENLRLLENNSHVSLSCSKYTYFYSEQPQNFYSIDLLHLNDSVILSPEDTILLIKKKKFWIPGSTAVVRSTLFSKYRSYSKKYSAYTDWFLLHKIAFSTQIAYIPSTLVAMRKHSNAYSITRSEKEKNEAWSNMILFLKNEPNNQLRQAFLKSDIFYNFNIDFFDFMLKYPRYWSFFKHHLWLRFFGLWFKKRLKPKLLGKQ